MVEPYCAGVGATVGVAGVVKAGAEVNGVGVGPKRGAVAGPNGEAAAPDAGAIVASGVGVVASADGAGSGATMATTASFG